MKYYLPVVFFALSNFILQGQNYYAEYSHTVIMDDVGIGKGILAFNAQEWYYNHIPSVDDPVKHKDENHVELLNIRDTTLFYYRSLAKNIYLDTEFLFIEKVIIKGELERLYWKIMSDSITSFGGYPCYKAKGKVAGRWFTAWFTPEIAVGAGPWKLWGLPGLIVKAESDDHILNFDLRTLSQCDDALPEPDVKGIRTVNKDEFKKELKQKTAKLVRYLNSFDSGSRNMEVSGSVSFNSMDKSLEEQ